MVECTRLVQLLSCSVCGSSGRVLAGDKDLGEAAEADISTQQLLSATAREGDADVTQLNKFLPSLNQGRD